MEVKAQIPEGLLRHRTFLKLMAGLPYPKNKRERLYQAKAIALDS
jgi:hypothetical protein